MPSLNYEEIYSKFRLKAESYDILQYREDDVSAVFMPEYLHASINKPYIRRLFSELKLGDTVQELTYIMKYSVDDDFDAEFITDILGIGMVIEWITPKINSLNNIQQDIFHILTDITCFCKCRRICDCKGYIQKFCKGLCKQRFS